MDEFTPPTEPFGSRTPPPKPPSTAIATASPAPLPPRPNLVPSMRERSLRRLLNDTLNAVDEVADSIAGALGLRKA